MLPWGSLAILFHSIHKSFRVAARGIFHTRISTNLRIAVCSQRNHSHNIKLGQYCGIPSTNCPRKCHNINVFVFLQIAISLPTGLPPAAAAHRGGRWELHPRRRERERPTLSRAPYGITLFPTTPPTALDHHLPATAGDSAAPPRPQVRKSKYKRGPDGSRGRHRFHSIQLHRAPLFCLPNLFTTFFVASHRGCGKNLLAPALRRRVNSTQTISV